MSTITSSTRKESFDLVKQDVATRQNIIHSFLLQYEDGLTANEIAAKMYEADLLKGWDRNLVHPRLTEMTMSGRVRVEERRKCSITDRSCGVYIAVTDEELQAYMDQIKEQDLFIDFSQTTEK
ncbi:hypothetical protein TCA2_4608 [Paenibacillus sp. TCA20]|uniref:Uncharacterized protein n=1 Tax=Paenibacillus urinalis TaxID=521520 RepID=A0ABY7XGZ8_9BACL|nr:MULTISPECIES: hypothetical protein [Paenibacillus]WDI05058.1 hypothetical protein PUW25_26170 [Paenibacillus urinalis]GAK42116.1 hypothetical protein TCA2_4608 [Paenibacillus sp. TCA20]